MNNDDGLNENTDKDNYEPRKVKYYGWKRDLPDKRDYYYTVSQPVPVPKSVDLRPSCPKIVYDQGALGACTANALAALYQQNEIIQKNALQFMPSRLFIYWLERYLEGTVNVDSGATLRDGIRALAKWGVCDENIWPYHIEKFAARPSDAAFEAAKKGIITKYSRIVQKLADMRTCLAAGDPFVIGIMVYSSFESKEVAKTGKVPMPSFDEQALGGHAVLVVGYNDADQTFLVRNSWGPKWGMDGYFTLPYEYVMDPDLTGDMWTIQMVPA